MIRWLVLATVAAARLSGGRPNAAVTPNRVDNEKKILAGKSAKSDSAAEAPRRTRSFHISRKFIDDGVDDQQRLLQAAATVAPTPIT